MNNKSRIYNFLNTDKSIALLAFEGRAFFEEFSQNRQQTTKSVEHFLQHTLLSLQPMINFLKPTEHLGIYLESKDKTHPFHFNLEMFEMGKTRSVLTPHGLTEIPEFFTGQCRVVKFLPYQRTPYQSLLSFDQVNYSEIVKQIFLLSYQFECEVILNTAQQKSFFIYKLPKDSKSIHINESPESTDSLCTPLQTFLKLHETTFQNYFLSDVRGVKDTVHFFEERGMDYQSSKVIDYSCHCSKERFSKHLYSLGADQIHEILREDGLIKVTCDYCQKDYFFYENDFIWQ
ncbi:MAG: Hsp33 family molecular chaperone HslO [Bacteriovoracaceae bacterium]|nr:Hsp33 family molecular chaperone HslO [Bacteriovoracaceae bacterium]